MIASEINIDQIKIGTRRRKDMGDLDALAKSIKELGLIQPVVIFPGAGHYDLLAGERRLRACKDILKWPKIEARIVESPDELHKLLVERDENEQRKEPSVSEKVAMGKAIEAVLGHGHKKERKKEKRANAHGSNVTAEIAAEAAGFDSRRTYERAKKVDETGSDKLKEAVDAGEVSVADGAMVAKLPPSEQDFAVEQVKAGGARTAAEAAKKNAGILFDDNKIDDAIGRLLRLFDERLGSYSFRNGSLHSVCIKAVEAVQVAWMDWRRVPNNG